MQSSVSINLQGLAILFVFNSGYNLRTPGNSKSIQGESHGRSREEEKWLTSERRRLQECPG